MIADAECIRVMNETLDPLLNGISNYEIQINHRKLLDGIFEVAGVPVDKFKTICSSVDKLDKCSWEDVKKEMCQEKGLNEAVADRIGNYVLRKGED